MRREFGFGIEGLPWNSIPLKLPHPRKIENLKFNSAEMCSNRLRRIRETEGQLAVRKALRALEPESYLRVAAAFLPDKVREAIKDEMAENGITEQDLREMAEKLHALPTKQ